MNAPCKNIAPHLAPGTPVTWTREVYRVQFRNRPIDTGRIIENDGSGFVLARRDDTGETVRGSWICFHPVKS